MAVSLGHRRVQRHRLVRVTEDTPVVQRRLRHDRAARHQDVEFETILGDLVIGGGIFTGWLRLRERA